MEMIVAVQSVDEHLDITPGLVSSSTRLSCSYRISTSLPLCITTQWNGKFSEHLRILSISIPAQTFSLVCILLCCISHHQTIKWQGYIFMCVIQLSYLIIHSFPAAFYVYSPWRVDKVVKYFHFLLQSIRLAFYLHSVFAAYYVSTPLNFKIDKLVHVLERSSHLRLYSFALALLQSTSPHY